MHAICILFTQKIHDYNGGEDPLAQLLQKNQPTHRPAKKSSSSSLQVLMQLLSIKQSLLNKNKIFLQAVSS